MSLIISVGYYKLLGDNKLTSFKWIQYINIIRLMYSGCSHLGNMFPLPKCASFATLHCLSLLPYRVYPLTSCIRSRHTIMQFTPIDR